MSTSITNSARMGLCPHGLSPGACSICSGGASNIRTADFSAKPGEMSWNECAAIGAFLKAVQNARIARENDFQQHLIAIAKFELSLQKASQLLNQFIQAMSKNNLTKPIAYIVQRFVLPVVRTVKNLPANVLIQANKFCEKLSDITDKLAAIYGELKAAVNKKISKSAKIIKKKLFSIFEIFTADNELEENEIMKAFHKKLNKLKDMIEKIVKQSAKGK